MTQQDIVNELNKMVVGYNINWPMIKYDADKAIMKINSYLGAEYPMMSQIMLSPSHRYTLNVGGSERPIFPERYILTVVIPYIATEVLARDEEFTTIYNKYTLDYENGLFEMFQNEYRKVPVAFRQDPDVGVFFSEDISKKDIQQKIDKNLTEFSFNVYYHFNFSEYPNPIKFTVDTNKYKYNSLVTILKSTILSFYYKHYSLKFKYWCEDPTDTTSPKYYPGDTINSITHDIHLYAIWEKDSVIDVNDKGDLRIKPDYAPYITNLEIPIFVEGKLVKAISTGFDKETTSLITITLPQTDLDILGHAFTKPTIRSIVFPAYDYLRDKPNITIRSNAISGTSINTLYLPYSVKKIEKGAIKGVPYIEHEIDIPPSDWAIDFYEGENTVVTGGVSNG